MGTPFGRWVWGAAYPDLHELATNNQLGGWVELRWGGSGLLLDVSMRRRSVVGG